MASGYPRYDATGFTEALWRVLRDRRTAAGLKLVGKSYGGGAIKVEPRALERLPLPDAAVEEFGLGQCLHLAGKAINVREGQSWAHGHP